MPVPALFTAARGGPLALPKLFTLCRRRLLSFIAADLSILPPYVCFWLRRLERTEKEVAGARRRPAAERPVH